MEQTKLAREIFLNKSTKTLWMYEVCWGLCWTSRRTWGNSAAWFHLNSCCWKFTAIKLITEVPSLTETCQFTSFKQCIRSDTVKTPIWKKLITRWTFFLTLSWPESARSLQFTQNASALHWLAVWKLLWVFPRKTKQRQRWDPELLEEQTSRATSHLLSFLCSYSVLFALSTSLEMKTRWFFKI